MRKRSQGRLKLLALKNLMQSLWQIQARTKGDLTLKYCLEYIEMGLWYFDLQPSIVLRTTFSLAWNILEWRSPRFEVYIWCHSHWHIMKRVTHVTRKWANDVTWMTWNECHVSVTDGCHLSTRMNYTCQHIWALCVFNSSEFGGFKMQSMYNSWRTGLEEWRGTSTHGSSEALTLRGCEILAFGRFLVLSVNISQMVGLGEWCVKISRLWWYTLDVEQNLSDKRTHKVIW
jgi:hypothetical protein